MLVATNTLPRNMDSGHIKTTLTGSQSQTSDGTCESIRIKFCCFLKIRYAPIISNNRFNVAITLSDNDAASITFVLFSLLFQHHQ